MNPVFWFGIGNTPSTPCPGAVPRDSDAPLTLNATIALLTKSRKGHIEVCLKIPAPEELKNKKINTAQFTQTCNKISK